MAISEKKLALQKRSRLLIHPEEEQITMVDVPEFPSTPMVDLSNFKDAAEKAKQSKIKTESTLGEQCLQVVKEVKQLRLYIGNLHMTILSVKEFEDSIRKEFSDIWTEMAELIDD